MFIYSIYNNKTSTNNNNNNIYFLNAHDNMLAFPMHPQSSEPKKSPVKHNNLMTLI